MKNHFATLLIIALVFHSCKKDDTKTTSQESVLDYFPLNKGSYWVYKQTEFDSSGKQIQNTWANDSIVVVNDTAIKGKLFHSVIEYNLIENNSKTIYYYRDSDDCIIDHTGEIIFSINHDLKYNKIFSNNSFVLVNHSFSNQISNISVPLGTFSCYDFKGDLTRKIDGFKTTYTSHNFTSKNIGIIKKNKYWIGSLGFINFELVNYKINN